MGSRFSKRAQGVLASAKTEAAKNDFPSPTSVHVLASLLSEKGGSAIAVLRKSGFEIKRLQSEFEEVVSDFDDTKDEKDNWSDLSEIAMSEAKRFDMETAGTAHLLLAILSHSQNRAATFLRRKGINLLKTRQLVFASLGDSRQNETVSSVQRPSLFAVTTKWKTEPEIAHKLIRRYEYEDRVMAILRRADTPNVVLVGEKSAGKSSVISNVVRQLSREMSPMLEVPVHAFRLELFRLVGWRWQRAQQKITDFVHEIQMPGPFVLVIDDVELFCGTVYWEEALFFLRLVLKNSNFPVVLELEPSTYECFIEEDTFLSSRLGKVFIPFPCGEEALKILFVVRDRLETFHGLKITDEAVERSFISASEERRDHFRFSCRILDQAASEAQTFEQLDTDGNISEIDERLTLIARQKQDAIEIQDYKHAAQLRDEESKLRGEKATLTLSNESDTLKIVDDAMVQALFDRLCVQPG